MDVKLRGRSVGNYIAFFGLRRFLYALKHPSLVIDESSELGPDITATACGRIRIDREVKLFGKAVLVGDDSADSSLEISEGTKINYGFYVNYSGGCSIGKRCAIASGVSLVTSSVDDRAEMPYADRPNRNAPIVVEDNCWIGTGAILLPGVRVPSRTIVGAGAVVTEPLPEPAVYAGVPARRIRDL